MSSDRWTHEIDERDVIVGDVIKEFNLGLGQGWIGNLSWPVGFVDNDGIRNANGGMIHRFSRHASRWRVVRAGRRWTHEVDGTELLVGDLIVEYKSLHQTSWELPLNEGGWRIDRIVYNNAFARKEWLSNECGLIHHDASEFKFRVVRLGTETAGPKAESPWNGRCPRCGKGTYTGFSSVEHEGGGCP